jgi:hypothetical protein
MTVRDIYSSFTDDKGEVHYYTKKENVYRRRVYVEALGKCCWPGCQYGYNLAGHHIILIKNGGTDDYNNIIVLCEWCHHHHKLHRLGINKQLELLVYKFYIEKIEIGFCSDEMDNEAFQLKCAKIAYKKRRKTNV